MQDEHYGRRACIALQSEADDEPHRPVTLAWLDRETPDTTTGVECGWVGGGVLSTGSSLITHWWLGPQHPARGPPGLVEKNRVSNGSLIRRVDLTSKDLVVAHIIAVSAE